LNDDATLVRAACSARSDSAFEALHRKYHALASHIAADFTTCGPERDDIVQESFARAWEKLDQLRDPDRFRPWFCRIVERVALDSLRRDRRTSPMAPDEMELDETSSWPAPEELAELAELAESLGVAITRLSARDATVITMAVQFGFGPNEIAAALDVTPGNAKVILHRARGRLRNDIRGSGAV
jgi:RNA polymerase sigma factor (sigma-70 family)